MANVLDNIDVVKMVKELVFRNSVPFRYTLPSLLIGLDLNLCEERFGLELSLIRFVDVLVVETFPKEFIRLVSPYLFPLSLYNC